MVAPNPDAQSIRVLAAAVLTAAEGTATPTDGVLCIGRQSIWFIVELVTPSTITEITLTYEARDEATGVWAPVDMQDLTVATGIATQRQFYAKRDVTGIAANGRRIFRVPAWVREVRAKVWASVGAPAGSSVAVYAMTGV